MRKWKNFRLKVIIAAVCLSGALIAGSTLAWFTDTAEVDPVTFKAGTVDIKAGGITDGSTAENFYQMIPYVLVDYYQATNVAGARKIPADLTAAREFILTRISQRTAPGYRPSEGDFYSLGKTTGDNISFIELELLRPLDVSKGIRIIECSWDKPSTEEKATIYVSGDGTDWEEIGTVSNRDEGMNVNHQHTSTIAIPDTIGTVKFIRIEDCTVSSSPDGYDIDFLGVYLLGEENNWNPGDTNFVAYEINNVGTKAIQLRASLSYEWQKYVEGEGWVPSDDPTDNVEIKPDFGSNWELRSDGYYYYNGVLNGTYSGNPGSAILYLSVHLKGLETGNEYQGKRFVITPTFQAIQNSHQGEWNWAEFDSYN